MKSAPAVLLLLAFTLCAQTLFAQLHVLPRVGVNTSALDTERNGQVTDLRVGWNAGLDLRLGPNKLFLQPGAHYYNFTARLVQKDIADQVTFRDETTIQAVQVPLNAGLRLIGAGKLLGLYLKGGVTPMFITGVDEKPGFAFNKDKLNDMTWNANVGAGLDLLIFNVELNYAWGLSDFFTDVEGRNQMWTLSAGFRF